MGNITNKSLISKSANYGDYKEIYLSIQPEDLSVNFQEQAKNCLTQLSNFFIEKDLSARNILSIVSLMRVENDEEYQKNCDIFEEEINDIFKLATKHIVSYSAQAPFQAQVVLEITLIVLKNKDFTYTQKSIDVKFGKKIYSIGYGVIESKEIKELSIEGVGIGEDFKDTFFQSDGAYFLLKEVLKAEKMKIKDIICQRNYIDQVVEIIKSKDGKNLQRYQIYNEKRGEYYGQKRWEEGYPAATGIGMNAGGVNIVSIRARALKTENEKIMKVFSISNPFQIDAHSYSKKVLVGDVKKTSPQFERAKAVVYDEKFVKIYISGTASVRGKKTGEVGEEVIGIGDVEKQTLIVLNNIALLISKLNLNKWGIPIAKNVGLKNLVMAKVYVKNESDFEKVIKICERKFSKSLPVNYAVADVCRPDWLVEIEGIASVKL